MFFTKKKFFIIYIYKKGIHLIKVNPVIENLQNYPGEYLKFMKIYYRKRGYCKHVFRNIL